MSKQAETGRREERCEMTDLPRLMCAHCSGRVDEVEVIGTYVPPSGDPVRLVRADLSAYRTLPYYPPVERRVSGVDGGRLCRCGAPCGDAFVCSSCADDLDRCLGDVPALIEDLDIAATRLDRVRSWPRTPRPKDSASLLEKPVSGWMFADSDTPLHDEIRDRSLRILGRGRPDNPGPAAARDQLTRVLVTAVAVIEPTMPGPFDAVSSSRWLLGHMRRIIGHPEASSIVEQVCKVHDRCYRMVDSAPDRTFYGYCVGVIQVPAANGKIEDRECGEPVVVSEDARQWTCGRCGYQWDVEFLESDRIERARGKLLTINEIAQWTGDAVRTVQSRLRRNGVWASGTREENGRPVQVYEAGVYLDIRARRPA